MLKVDGKLASEGKKITDLTDELQMFIAGKRVVQQAAVHLFMPVSPFYIKLCQCLRATRLKDYIKRFRDGKLPLAGL